MRLLPRPPSSVTWPQEAARIDGCRAIRERFEMDERKLRGLIERVKVGKMSRRAFVTRMAAVGFTAPMATQLLAIGGVAQAQSASTYKPTKRGGGGTLKTLFWQGSTLLNPHFANGTKDQEGS